MPGKLGTVNGYTLFEVSSFLQKSIRRGLVENAAWCAVELDVSGYGEYCWRRLRIMASEDVGLANPMVSLQVDALYNSWADMAHRDQDGERLFLMHAVLLLATSPKSRAVDNMTIVSYSTHSDDVAVPEWAHDMHTQQGRRMGRGVDHFYEEGALTAPGPQGTHPVVEAIVVRDEDPWLDEARSLRNRGVKPIQKVPRKRTERQARLSEAVAAERGGEQ